MVPVEPLRDCLVIVVGHTAFLFSSVLHFMCAPLLSHERFVSIFETFHAHCLLQVCRGTVPSLYNSLREEILSNLQPGWLWPQVQRIR